MTLILKTCFIKTLLGEVWASLMLCQRLYTDICYDLNPGLRNLVQDHYNLYNFRVIMSQIWPKGKKICSRQGAIWDRRFDINGQWSWYGSEESECVDFYQFLTLTAINMVRNVLNLDLSVLNCCCFSADYDHVQFSIVEKIIWGLVKVYYKGYIISRWKYSVFSIL